MLHAICHHYNFYSSYNHIGINWKGTEYDNWKTAVLIVLLIFLVQPSELKVASGARWSSLPNQQVTGSYSNSNSLSSGPVVMCNPKSGASLVYN